MHLVLSINVDPFPAISANTQQMFILCMQQMEFQISIMERWENIAIFVEVNESNRYCHSLKDMKGANILHSLWVYFAQHLENM